MSNIVFAIYKAPGLEPKYVCLDNTLEAFQNAIGGYIEIVNTKYGVVICDEEGLLKSLPYNCSIDSVDLCGPVLIVGERGDQFANCEFKIEEVFK